PPVSPEASPSAQPGDLDELATAIAAVAGRYVPAGQLAPDADFFDAGGTSVNAVELVSALEDELGVTVGEGQVGEDLGEVLGAGHGVRPVGEGRGGDRRGPKRVRRGGNSRFRYGDRGRGWGGTCGDDRRIGQPALGQGDRPGIGEDLVQVDRHT
ncbi:acyl carrier protein, partial [Streptomyces sp. uw30]